MKSLWLMLHLRSSTFLPALMVLTMCAPASAAEPAEKTPAPPVQTILSNNVAPLPSTEKIAVSHAPFEAGDCSVCHQSKDPKNPGPLQKPVNDGCLECHDDFEKLLKATSTHAAAKASCVNCHNPHNAKFAKLLIREPGGLCFSCHTSISNSIATATVKHDALTMNGGCANCHNAHGANVEHLLTKMPGDICMDCHGKEGLKDHDGKLLTNFKKLLEENPEAHGPVVNKDCTACHKAHGGESFRLLTMEYPANFYAPYDPKLYALCFDCHEETIIKEEKTTTLTSFRNGDKNLHFVHVNKAERGRTCRACHEVHAAKQKHQIRDAVPYGSKGWMLKVNFTQTPSGGSCAKTCHETRSYTNAVTAAAGPEQPSAPPATSP